MSYQSDIYTAINAHAGTSALVSGRVFPDVADAGTIAPFLVYSTVASSGETDFSGKRDLTFPLMRFTAWAESKAQSIAIIAQLRGAIEGKNLPGSSESSLGFSNSFSIRDQQTKLFGEIIEYRVSANTN